MKKIIGLTIMETWDNFAYSFNIVKSFLLLVKLFFKLWSSRGGDILETKFID